MLTQSLTPNRSLPSAPTLATLTLKGRLCSDLSRQSRKSSQRFLSCLLACLSECLVRSGPETWLPSDWPDSVCNCVTRHYFLRRQNSPGHPQTFSLPPTRRRTVWSREGGRDIWTYLFSIKKKYNLLSDCLISEYRTCDLSPHSLSLSLSLWRDGWRNSAKYEFWHLVISVYNDSCVDRNKKRRNLLAIDYNM